MASLRNTASTTPLENELSLSHALISWRSIVAGLLVAFFCMIGLLGLGMAFGGIGLDEETSAKSAGIFTGVWFLVSTLLSLFVGSYFAGRVSKFRTARIGSAQGLVIAALFLGLFLYQTLASIGAIGSAAGSLVGNSASLIGQGVSQAANNPTVTNTVNNMAENALGDLNLKSDPQTVAKGLSTRLIQGDAEGAKNYLATQAGITPTEADVRIAQLKAQVDKTLDDVKAATATALRSAGWTLFLLVALGALSAIGGGALGSVANFRRPLILDGQPDFSRRQQHA